tara:strand:+ start:25930 stop:26190 length:261 start_codon:yes stop_codon:yes gene_type:complete
MLSLFFIDVFRYDIKLSSIMSKKKTVTVKYIGEKTDIINAVVGSIPEKGKKYNIPASEWEAASKDDWAEDKKTAKKAAKKIANKKN